MEYLLLGFWLWVMLFALAAICVVCVPVKVRVASANNSYHIQLASEIADVESHLQTTRGNAGKALELTLTRLKSELEIAMILSTPKPITEKLSDVRDNLTELYDVLGARETPYGRDLARSPFRGIPTHVLDIQWQVYKSFLEVISA